MPADVELSLATTEQIVDELNRRNITTVVLIEYLDTVGEDRKVRYFYDGGSCAAVGLATAFAALNTQTLNRKLGYEEQVGDRWDEEDTE